MLTTRNKPDEHATNTIQIEDRVFCSKCNKGFKRKAILKSHILTKHLGYKASCPVCKKNFISVSVVNRHLRVVHSILNHKKFNIILENESNTPVCFQAAEDVSLTLRESGYQAAKSFPCMVDALKLKENITFGKHIVATNDIDVGKTVLISPAYASIEYVSSRPDSCFQCGGFLSNRIQCQYCIDVYFCSTKCSLSRDHRMNCNKKFNQSDCKTVRLVTKIIDIASKSISDVNIFLEFCKGILLNNKKTKDCKPPFSQYGEILQLKGIAEKNHVSIAKRVVNCVKSLPQFSSFNSAECDRTLFYVAYQHTTTIALNTFSEETVLTKGGIFTRFSIHDILSRVNHSCAPNLHHCIDDNNITYCVVIRPIKEGDQLFINYLGEMKFATDDDRQIYLKENWGFNCKCEKCRLKFFACNGNDGMDQSYYYIKQNFDQLQSHNLKELKTECVKYLNKYGGSWTKTVEFVTYCIIQIIHNS